MERRVLLDEFLEDITVLQLRRTACGPKTKSAAPERHSPLP
jgi:hypothetical protein